jgi:hypothetical protein
MENQKPSEDSGKDVAEASKISITAKCSSKLPAAGWGLQFIWIGISLLLKLKAGYVLYGIGAIILLVQVVRKYLMIRLQIFYIVVGLLFMMGGFLKNWKPNSPIIPVFLIIVGTGLLLSFIKYIISK